MDWKEGEKEEWEEGGGEGFHLFMSSAPYCVVINLHLQGQKKASKCSEGRDLQDREGGGKGVLGDEDGLIGWKVQTLTTEAG